jgi:integrase
VLTNAELVTVWRAADDDGYPVGTIIKLLMWTGQRRNEIASLRWEYIDTENRTITLPDTFSGQLPFSPHGEPRLDPHHAALRSSAR